MSVYSRSNWNLEALVFVSPVRRASIFCLERAYENKNRGGFIDFKRKRVGFQKEKKKRSVYRLVFEEREKLESPKKNFSE